MQNTTLYVIYALIFVVVVMLVEGIYLLISDPTKNERIANRRMELISKTNDETAGIRLLNRQKGGSFNQKISSILPKLDGMLWAANSKLTASGFVMTMVALVVIVFLALSLTGFMPVFPAMVFALAFGIIVPLFAMSRKAKKRRQKFSEQLCPAIDLVCRSLQAGHPAVVALEMVSREMPDPIGTEFGIAMDQVNFGLDRNVALANVAERFPDPDLRFFNSALEIQRSTGANLVEILSNLSRVIRNRIGMRKKIKAMSAEGRFTALIVGILPFGVAVMIGSLNPGHYLDHANDPMQIIGLVIPAFLYVIGMVWIWRMVNIKI